MTYAVEGQAARTGGVCSVEAATLGEARRVYAARCELPRLDCDPVGGGWACSSHRIGKAAPARAPVPAPTRPVPAKPAEPVSPSRQSGACEVTEPTLSTAKKRYAERCADVRRDCDAVGGGWTCASYRIGSAAPGSVAVRPPSAPTPPPVTSPAPDETPAAAGTLRVEAESGAVGAGWQREGGYIIWRGRPDRYNLSQRRDDANIAYALNVPTAGRYRFTMRSAALEGSNPAEPPNDVWVRFGQVPWTKAYMPRNRAWHVAATGERDGRHSPELLESDLPAGPVTLTISGRSTGHAIDWLQLNRVGDGSVAASEAPTPDDLIALHFDFWPDYDDGAAAIAMREILDERPELDVQAVTGTIGTRFDRVIPGAFEHVRSMFPGTVDAHSPGAVARVATEWELTLRGGDRVFVAEAGPSDFTARVVRELQRRGVPNLKSVRVTQHSSWNEDQTADDSLAFVRSATTYTRIEDGNQENSTPDFNQNVPAIEPRLLASRYGSQWRFYFSTVTSQSRRHDWSDTVELMHILGLPKSTAPGVRAFVDRYI